MSPSHVVCCVCVGVQSPGEIVWQLQLGSAEAKKLKPAKNKLLKVSCMESKRHKIKKYFCRHSRELQSPKLYYGGVGEGSF